MRFVMLSAVILTSLIATPSFAQNYQYSAVTSAAREIYDSCTEVSDDSGISDPRAACACVAGYLAGVLSDRDYEAMGLIIKIGAMDATGAPQSEIDAQLEEYFARGFQPADVDRLLNTFEAVKTRGGAVCDQFSANPSV